MAGVASGPIETVFTIGLEAEPGQMGLSVTRHVEDPDTGLIWAVPSDQPAEELE